MEFSNTKPSKERLVSFNLERMRIVTTITQMFDEIVYLSVSIAKQSQPHEQSAISLSFSLEDGVSNFEHLSAGKQCIEIDELSSALGSALHADIDQLLALCVSNYRDMGTFSRAMEEIKKEVHNRVDMHINELFQ
nr:hypothetical protein [Vibrio splendidus]MCC4882496.1 hypothetical protein [Vibrio splendidus]